MRVLHILKITRVAGVERHLLMLCQGLRREGIDARLLLLVERRRPMTEYVAECEQRGIPSQRMTIYHDADPSLPTRLSRAIREQDPDIAHLHLIHAEIHGNLAARSAGVPRVFVSRHNQDSFRERPPLRALLRRLWGRVDLAIVIAEHLREQVRETEGAPAAKIRRIYYGLEASPPSQPPDLRAELGLPRAAPLIGAVCRLVPQKGLSDGLAAFARGAPKNAHLAIIGDGPLRGSLEAQAAALPCRERVHFLGWRPDAAQCLAALDILLMPSRWEGFGLVLLEAFVAGLPILASNVGGIAEVVVDGESGLLCPPGDIDAFAAALAHLCAEAELRARLAAAGRERFAARFTAARMVAETLALYREFAEAKR